MKSLTGSTPSHLSTDEATVAHIIGAVLGQESIGLLDDFFELGGDSLLASRVMAQLNAAFATHVSLLDFFEQPTVAQVTKALVAARDSALPSHYPAIERADPDIATPLSYQQESMVPYCTGWTDSRPFYNMSIAAKLSGPIAVRPMRMALVELVRLHAALRMRFLTTHGSHTQYVGAPGQPQFDFIDASGAPTIDQDEIVVKVISRQALQPFDFTRDLLLRASLIRLSESEHIFTFTTHHLIVDTWAITLLVRDLATLYRHFAQGDIPAPPQPNLDYRDYAVWQRRYMSGAIRSNLIKQWDARLAGNPGILQFPRDHSPSSTTTSMAVSQAVTIPTSITHRVVYWCRETGTTPYMFLLSAFNLLAQSYTRQNDIVTGTPVANRQISGTDSLVGFLANSVLMRVNLSDNPRFIEILERVKLDALKAFSQQDLHIIDYMKTTSKPDLYRVKFALENTPPLWRGFSEITGVPCTPVQLPVKSTVRCDVSLTLREAEGAYSGHMVCNADYFSVNTAAKLARDYLTLLELCTHEPGLTARAISGVLRYSA